MGKLTLSHWNLNSISGQIYSKVSLLRAYLTIHKFHIVSLSESYPDSNTAHDNSNQKISSYNLIIPPDHPSSSKRGSFCISYKSFLHLRVLNTQYLHECINTELKIGDKFCYIIDFYRSSSQSQDPFEKFSKKPEKFGKFSPKNLFLVVLIGDFNTKSKS